MGKGRQIKAKVTARRKPKISSNKGGFLVARVTAINQKTKAKNG